MTGIPIDSLNLSDSTTESHLHHSSSSHKGSSHDHMPQGSPSNGSDTLDWRSRSDAGFVQVGASSAPTSGGGHPGAGSARSYDRRHGYGYGDHGYGHSNSHNSNNHCHSNSYNNHSSNHYGHYDNNNRRGSFSEGSSRRNRNAGANPNDNAFGARDIRPRVYQQQHPVSPQLSYQHSNIEVEKKPVLCFARVFTDDMNAQLMTTILEMANGEDHVKSTSHREKQTFSFVEFDTEETLESVLGKVKVDSFITESDIEVFRTDSITHGRDPRLFDVSDERNTTLVLKNLVFTLKQEDVEDILSQVRFPPLTMALHCDSNGKFRGMVFAKYRSLDESEVAYKYLNGMDIVGRKLKVEYKNKVKSSSSSAAAASSSSSSAEISTSSIETSQSARSFGHHIGMHGSSSGNGNGNGNMEIGHTGHPPSFDLNDDETLQFYNQILLFKQNTLQQSMTLSPTLSVHQRKLVHILAEKIGGIGHVTTGEGRDRCLVLSKEDESSSSSSSNVYSSNGLPVPRTNNHIYAQQQQQQQQQQYYSNGGTYPNNTGRSWGRNGGSFKEQMDIIGESSGSPMRQPRGPPSANAKGFAAGRGRGAPGPHPSSPSPQRSPRISHSHTSSPPLSPLSSSSGSNHPSKKPSPMSIPPPSTQRQDQPKDGGDA